MSKREIASLAIKLMGVFLVVTSIGYLSMYIGFFEASGLLRGVLMCVGCLASPVLGVLVIVFSDKIAAKLIREDNVYVPSGEEAMTKNDVMAIAFTCIGLYVAVNAVPQVFSTISQYLFITRKMDSGFSFQTRTVARYIIMILASIAKLSLGLWLFMGSRGIVRLWHKIRS